MKKTFSSLIALLMVFSLFVLSVPAIAASDYSGAIGGFKTSPKSEYTPGSFSDVNENQWFGANEQAVIQKAYELQIMVGANCDIFAPWDNLTLAEAVKMAAVVHNIYNGGDGSFTQGSPWYQVYVDYAIASRFIGEATIGWDWNRAATRAEMAYIFARCVPASELPEINKVVYLPDIPDSRVYGEDVLIYGDNVYTLYRAGVLTGNDSLGTFKPFSNITRAEAAAIICRIVLPAERKTLNLSQVVISGDYATDELLAKYDSFTEFDEFDDEDYQRIIIAPSITIKDFKFIELGFDPDDSRMFFEKRVLALWDELSPEKPFVVTWMDIGTIPHRGISFTDENGAARYFSISMSGLDGSLILSEF